MTPYKSILKEAASLSVEDRLQLIDDLWESLPENAPPRISREWLLEVQRRTKEFEAHPTELPTWEEVKLEARKKFGMINQNDID